MLSPSDLALFLRERGLSAELLALPVETPTVQAAAEAVGTSSEKIVKSVLFMVDERPVLAITSGECRIDRRRIAKSFGVGRKRVRLADENQVQTSTGYPVGAVPPFGHPEPLLTIIDPGVLEHDMVYAGGGASDHLIRVETAEILRVTQGEVLELLDRSE
ncbi:MAG: YbaK/EbsC family protein [Anaerolineales bacterium]|nr:YbaK/EbsC family protein [Anaerolineales bacterium]HUS85123.1 YbaK/EbsC family protein [Anaerolineales bacterium]